MKLLALLLAVLSLLFSSCGKPKQPNGWMPADLPAPSASEAAPTEETHIPDQDSAIPFDDRGALWQIPNQAVESGIFQELYAFRGNILLVSESMGGNGKESLTLQLLSSENGEILCSAELLNIGSPSLQVLGDSILVADTGAGRISVLNENLEIRKERDFPVIYNQVYLNPTGDIAYSFNIRGELKALDLENGEERSLLSQASNLYSLSSSEENVVFRYTDMQSGLYRYFSLNLSDEKLEEVPFGADYSSLYRQEDFWLGQSKGSESCYYLGSSSDYYGFLAGDKKLSLLSENRLLCQTEVSSSRGITLTLELYDCSGKGISSAALPLQDSYVGSFVPNEDGCFFLVSSYFGEPSKLFYWDYSEGEIPDDLLLFPNAEFPEAGNDRALSECSKRAKALSEEFQVEVLLGKQCKTDFSDYSAEQIKKVSSISAALDQLEIAFSSYPDGFFSQLLHDDLRSVEIHLCGPLTAKNSEIRESGFGDFRGFVEETEGKYLMVLDISGDADLTGSIYHEISHMIDSKLQADALLRDDALFSEEIWASLNPADFDYSYSYAGLTPSAQQGKYEDYFTDSYARTFPTEDRARLMEYAMTSGYLLAGNTGLLGKLSYYSRCIRDCFDCEGWPGITLWEQVLAVG